MSDLQYFKNRYEEMVGENTRLQFELAQTKEILEAKHSAIKAYNTIESRLNKECHFLALEKQQLGKALELASKKLLEARIPPIEFTTIKQWVDLLMEKAK